MKAVHMVVCVDVCIDLLDECQHRFHVCWVRRDQTVNGLVREVLAAAWAIFFF